MRRAAKPMYQLFDLCIESELALPGLVRGGDRPPDWAVTLHEGEADTRGFERYHAWRDAGGREIMSAARRGAAYLIEFAGLGQFCVDFETGRLRAWRAAGCTDGTLAHLLVDQVFPRVVGHGGRLVLHASAVGLPGGDAIAFTGRSGCGKSTLASAFYRAGHRLLSDDCLLLEWRNGKLLALAPYRSLRLWPDTADALFAGDPQHGLRVSPMAHYTTKKVLSPAGQPAAEPVALRALYLLEPPGPLRVRAARGMRAIMALVEAQFTLDPADEEAVRRNFSAVQQSAGRTPVLGLAYPRDYAELSRVIEKILEAAEAGPAAEAV